MSENIEQILKFAELYSEAAGNRNEYMREYMAKRYHDTRQKLYERLGGKCQMCGTTEGPFDLDHIDASTKSMRASDLHSVNDQKFEEEVGKLWLLCPSCHKNKSVQNGELNKNKARHGTVWYYRKYKCRCPECVKAYRDSFKKKDVSTPALIGR